MAKEIKSGEVLSADEVFNEELTAEEQKTVDDAADKLLNEHITPGGLWDFKPVKPIYCEGQEYDVLNFDFSELHGDDGFNIEDEVETVYHKSVFNPIVCTEYLLLMAIRACKQRIDMDTLKRMSLPDFNRVKSNARLFLLTFAG